MDLRKAARWAACGVFCLGALYAFQRPFRQFPGVEYFSFELTPDWQEKTEFAFARLMFPPGPLNGYRRPRRRMAHGNFAVDAGLPARRPSFFPGGAPPDARFTRAAWSSR